MAPVNNRGGSVIKSGLHAFQKKIKEKRWAEALYDILFGFVRCASVAADVFDEI